MHRVRPHALMNRPYLRLLAAFAVPVLALLATDAIARGQAPTPTSFQAVAGADGMRAYLIVPGAPLSNTVSDGGAPVTQALVNGVGESVGFAAMPHPGENAIALPSLLVPLLVPQAPSVPPYPLMARSESPTTPTASASGGAIELQARSTERLSEASSVSGGGENQGASVGQVETHVIARLDDAGGVVSEAMSAAESFSATGVLRIGATTATAMATHPADGPPTAESSFTAEGVTVAGTAVGVSDKGILLPGQTNPVPDTSGLSPALDAVGVSMRYLAAQEVDDGVVSAGLEVVVPVVIPGTGTASVRYVFGQARAIASSSGIVLTEDSTPPLPTDDGTVAPPSAPSDDVAGAPVDVPDTPADTGSDVDTPAPRSPRPVVARVPATASATGFYLVLVVGAVVSFTGGLLVRLIGVRLAWTS